MIKKSFILLLGLWTSGTLAAQVLHAQGVSKTLSGEQTVQSASAPQPVAAAQNPPAVQRLPHTGVMEKPARYLYAELIGTHLPSYTGDKVIFDFGQSTKALSYNRITDDQGRKIRFNSMVEALNYMIRQRWEFVQAYSTTDGTTPYVHYLLRIRVEEIPSSLREQLPPVPDGITEPENEPAALPAKAE